MGSARLPMLAQLIATDEVICDAHWAFIGHLTQKPLQTRLPAG